MHDLKTNIQTKIALNVQTINSDTTTDGVIIDTQGFLSLTFIHLSGTLTLGTFTPKIMHGDAANLSDAAEVTDAFLIGTEAQAALVAADDNKTKRIGCVGHKRYVRFSDVSTDSADGLVGAIAILGDPKEMPKAQDA